MSRSLRLLIPLALVIVLALPAGAAERLTGVVVTESGSPLAGVTVSHGDRSMVTGADGRYVVEGASGPIGFHRPGYEARSESWDGSVDWLTVPLSPRIVRGIHVAGWVAAEPGDLDEMFELAADTAINAFVVDLKNENGRVYHTSAVPLVEQAGAGAADQFDLAALVDRAHAEEVYVIVRIVSFQDPIVALSRPSMAVHDRRDGSVYNHGGQRFLDPTDPQARAYALDLAVEACAGGVDEIQFDYVRFPDGGRAYTVFDGRADAVGRQATITAFLAEARSMIEPMGCAVAADIFGWITHTPTEGGIGQHLESVAGAVDVVSPMIYPSHYSAGWYGFADPNAHPAEVVTYASRDGLARMSASPGVLRPWIQDFWYDAGQVRAQIDALDTLGLGWMSWNILSVFTDSAYPAEGVLSAGDDVPETTTATLPASGFWDVDDGSVFSADVGWMGASGITAGCNPPFRDYYCPNDSVTRGQMAAFLVRALDLPSADSSPFGDVNDSEFEDDIATLARAGITKGCNPPANDRFCPEAPVQRGEMAAFLVRALGLVDADPSIVFTDDDSSVFEADIARLASAGITFGCNPPANDRFCPTAPVTRAEMAAFLHRALG